MSTGGAVVSLLDWRTQSQQLPASLNVTVRLDFDIAKVTAVRAGLKLRFTSVKQGGEFLISFATELMDCDFITLEAKPKPTNRTHYVCSSTEKMCKPRAEGTLSLHECELEAACKKPEPEHEGYICEKTTKKCESSRHANATLAKCERECK